MQTILNIEATRAAEARAEAAGYPPPVLMERAGRALADHIKHLLSTLPPSPPPRVTFLIGPGNNGGDGLVAGRILADEMPVLVRFYLTKARAEDDPVFRPVRDRGLFTLTAESDQRFRVLTQLVASADLIVDALFGIGTRLPMRPEAVKLLKAVAQARRIEEVMAARVLAVDCPSGIDCDTGEADAAALAADETLTFIGIKPGLLLPPAVSYVGKLRLASLDLPPELVGQTDSPQFLVDARDVAARLPERPLDGHKGTFGTAVIAAGSSSYSGAAGLSARAAYRVGAGLVRVAAPARVIDRLASSLLEPTWVEVPDVDGIIGQEAAAVVRGVAAGADALLVGPGLDRSPGAAAFLADLLRSGPLPPLVLDADALNLLAQQPDLLNALPPDTILTPHPGEMARLCQLDVPAVQSARMKLALEKAAAWKCVIILKGAHTLIAAPDGRLAVLPFKTTALAKAGTGDVLAGAVVGLLAQGAAPFDAATAAAYLHGQAGESAAAQAGSPAAVLASEVSDALGQALASLR